MAKREPRKPTKKKELDASLPIFQLKISLDEIGPAVWRRVQTHNVTLADLHEIIQCSMGWDDDHMYVFEVGDDEYGVSDEDGYLSEFEDAKTVRLSELVEWGESCFIYEYDFGDSWRHTIKIEKTLPAKDKTTYPICVAGSRACPPEDCGGVPGYYQLIETLENPDEEEEERLEWLGDYDPEEFNLDDVNRHLHSLRRRIGRRPFLEDQTASFAVGDRIRAKQGVVHFEYPDIPLGGWVGTVTKIIWLLPIGYEVEWTEETLAAAHPVYAKRCRRDEKNPKKDCLDEHDAELDSPEHPMEMEQPANLIVKPLSPDDSYDRIRTIFGLTGDDPLPDVNEASLQQYLAYLKEHLAFPFKALYWLRTEYAEHYSEVSVIGFDASSPIDAKMGLICEIRVGEKTAQAPMRHLDMEDDNYDNDPNTQYVNDFSEWFHEAHNPAFFHDEPGEYWDEDDDFEEEDWDGEEYADEDELAEEDDDFKEDIVPMQPFHREQPHVGRNDPCPCGSGKKFKKCCLNKPKIEEEK